jgi:hypothetical protein
MAPEARSELSVEFPLHAEAGDFADVDGLAVVAVATGVAE